MVAYSFKARFAAPITDGSKRQTIRAPRRRHARPGEELQLYQGMRTKSCKLMLRSTCAAVDMVEINLLPVGIVDIHVNGIEVTDLDAFARADGFRDVADMGTFWLTEHGAGAFTGVLIKW